MTTEALKSRRLSPRRKSFPVTGAITRMGKHRALSEFQNHISRCSHPNRARRTKSKLTLGLHRISRIYCISLDLPPPVATHPLRPFSCSPVFGR